MQPRHPCIFKAFQVICCFSVHLNLRTQSSSYFLPSTAWKERAASHLSLQNNPVMILFQLLGGVQSSASQVQSQELATQYLYPPKRVRGFTYTISQHSHRQQGALAGELGFRSWECSVFVLLYIPKNNFGGEKLTFLNIVGPALWAKSLCLLLKRTMNQSISGSMMFIQGTPSNKVLLPWFFFSF